MTIVTTSWDDGDALDMRVADMLDRFGVRGTFYVARTYRSDRLSDADIRALSERHEVGAHTLTHPDLTLLSREGKRSEIEGGKAWLEEVTGKPVEMFCYPGGKFDDETVELVRQAGFIGARTTKRSSGTFDPFRFGVSLTFYPYPFTGSDRVFAGYRKLIEPFSKTLPASLAGETWQRHDSLEHRIAMLFEEARARDGIFHLYGHSWANTRYGLWPVLERSLSVIAGKSDCTYLTNAEAVKYMRTHSGQTPDIGRVS